MKKIIYVILALLFSLVIYYISYGFFLNLTLKEQTFDTSQDFNIPIRITDSTYKGGRCANIIKIYPWELPNDTPDNLFKKDGSGEINQDIQNKLISGQLIGKINCTTKSTPYPFQFQYIESWENKRRIETLFYYNLSSFKLINNFFFNEKMSICLENIDKPLVLDKEEYSTEWFSMRGFKYKITLSENDKVEWKAILDKIIIDSNYPKMAKLIKGENCKKYTPGDIVKEYQVKFTSNW